MNKLNNIKFSELFMDESFPQSLSLKENTSYEALLFKILSGSLSINIKSYKKYSLAYNFYTFPQTEMTAEKYNEEYFFSNLFKVTNYSPENLTNFFKYNKINTAVFESIVREISYSLVKYSNEMYISSFVHIYRCIEYISYTFPYLFISHSLNFKGTYDKMKDFFSEKSELKMFKHLQDLLFSGENILEANMEFNYLNISEEDLKYIKDEVLCQVYFPNVPFQFDNNKISIKFENMFDFIITLRNRYFHMLVGTTEKYIEPKNLDMEYVFQGINLAIINWFSIIYSKLFETTYENFIRLRLPDSI